MKWLDEISYIFLAAIAVLMALLPFEPQPHLTEKLDMLLAGTLVKPIDIFDLFWHLLPTILIVVKLIRSKKAGQA